MKKPQTRKMKNSEKNKLVFWTFFITLTLSQVIMYITNIISDGHAMYSLIYNMFDESFMDFFNPFSASMLNKPYSSINIGEYAFYSPVIMLIFKLFTHLAPSKIYEADISYYIYFSETLVVMFLFTVFAVVTLSVILYNKKEGNAAIKFWFLFLILFSAPMIYNYERGSIIILAVAFVLLYIFNINDDRAYVRHLSLLALALAVSLKPYTIIFLVLILRDKRFKDSLYGLLYSILLWIVPSFFVGGISIFSDVFSKIPDFIFNVWDAGDAYRTDIFSCLDIVSMTLGYEPMSNYNVLKYIIWGILIVGLVICGFVSKSQWKRILALSLFVVTAPFAENETSVVFLIIPILFCIDSKDERKIMDVIYVLLFIIIYAPIMINDTIINLTTNHGNELYLHSYMVSIALIIFVIMILIEAITIPLAGIELNDPKPEKEKEQKEKQ